jgi:uncharacterized protein (DUF2062 family)
MSEEHHRQRLLRFARIRRAKFWLRFMPRRARFHTYPIVGRFAAFARRRSYLWNFRYTSLRPSFYLGSILSLMPAMGVQLPFAFALSLMLRTNFMVTGGLQFITNPVTAAPVYYGTYKLGESALHLTGWGPLESVAPVTASPDIPRPPADAPPTGPNWLGELATRFRVSNLTHLFNCLVVGGLLAGIALGAALDLLWRFLVLPAARHHAARKPVTAVVTPHDGTRPPMPPPGS